MTLDPELARLLVSELERHAPALEAVQHGGELEVARRALHALKGSAGLAGEGELSAALGRLERKVRAGSVEAATRAAELVRRACGRLRAGEPALVDTWPEAPPDLEPPVLEPAVRAQYVAEIVDRLAGIDEALAPTMPLEEAASALYRHVHTMKGAASAVGDEPMAWFCHGLEERLRAAPAASVVEEVGRWRAVLGGLLDDEAATLFTLRPRAERGSALPARPPTMRPDDEGPRSVAAPDATIRVQAGAIDRVIERVAALARAQAALAARGAGDAERTAWLRKLRADLSWALRLIGPPRPWGAPAAAIRRIEDVASALLRMSEDLEVEGDRNADARTILREGIEETKRDLIALRQANLAGLFARMAGAIEVEARQSGREVVVRTRGASELLDRRVVEQLAEPCLQLARNAVAHGIETPDERRAAGKPSAGTIAITAARHGSRLRLSIEDDGAGVDLAGLRERAVRTGVLAAELADVADDDTLLGLLFLPGMSTRESADLLAGRGIGLDIVLSGIQRMAGSIRLSSTRGQGFAAHVDVPIESGVSRVVWVRCGREYFGMMVSHVRRVHRAEDWPVVVPHMLACLGEPVPPGSPPLGLELDGDPREAILVGVDEVGLTEEHVVRPLPALAAACGPYVGVVVRGDGAPRLLLDATALAARARAIVGALERAPSSRPPAQPGALRSP
jgi:chemotaxis protein histidine kinase CheA